ncbi:amino acid adenylation domain-containing protein [Ktedonosporobacter rubrisoli]|uniref:Amino acid adenylation domain-containing protein n=1 Tax=Ktedonosporobacter rubrisoli TaxID=2509675 RepID=A0A4V0YZQ3_KTERU|nr:non-ribosomal peptide synthetase [Ktedonosporobacter rubrisoli]QBD80521.1 amino acid adenylation domain-containing protein [Ktedonosporobacter rubrisoli]
MSSVPQVHQTFHSSALNQHKAYWSKQLQDLPVLVELPLDHQRPSRPANRRAAYDFTFPAELSEALSKLQNELHAAPDTICLAAFAASLFRYTLQEDILISTTQGSLDLPNEEDSAATYTIARIRCTGELSFSELVGHVQQILQEACPHALPLAMLDELLQTKMVGRSRPLQQLHFQYATSSTVDTLPSADAMQENEIMLAVMKGAEGLCGRMTYDAQLFAAETIERMVGHWQTLLLGASKNPAQRVAVLPLLTEQERQQVVLDWNAQRVPFDASCVHELFEEQVARTPDAIAVVAGIRKLSYRELNSRANQLAHYLRRLGVGPDVMVGLCVKRSLDMMVGIMGILKAGGAYVPLDPSYPQERLSLLLQDSQTPILLTQSDVQPTLPRTQARTIALDSMWPEITKEDDKNPVSGATAENLVYIIYTSGSTGTPKGVMICHRSLVNYAQYEQRHYHIGPKDRILQFSSVSFDASAEEIYVSLISGATLYLRSEDMLDSVPHFLQLCREWGITMINFSTAYWHELTLSMEERGLALPPTLRVALIGGERAIPERLQAWQRMVGRNVRLLNTYGPTEATITVTVKDLTPAEVETEQRPTHEVLIGRPVDNAQAYLLDEELKPVPIGVPGELCVGGACLARGYYNRPELTNERFIPDPFSQEPQARLYRTGDLARYMPDGNLEYLGRGDQQVKIRGFRIELGEIEAGLSSHPAIREAVVIAREDTPGNARLVAYIVFQPSQNATDRELQTHLAQRMPIYMVPTTFIRLEALPLNTNGKVDRKALTALEPQQAEKEKKNFVGPTTEMHYKLSHIWEELLHIHPIDIRDDFFALGGHSLLAVRMMGMVEQVCGQQIPMATLFKHSTIEGLAQVLEQGIEAPTTRVRVVPIQEGGSQLPFFFLHGDWKGGAFYCLKLAKVLGPEQPFYALDPYRFDGLLVPPDFTEIASAHIEAIRQVQPHGPYIIGGFCNGALFAAEIARQLREAGERVLPLVLIDADTFVIPERIAQQFITNLGDLFHLSKEQQFEAFLLYQHARRQWRKVQRKSRKLWHRTTEGQEPGTASGDNQGVPREGRIPLIPNRRILHLRWSHTYSWVAANYKPRPYSGSAIMLWTRDSLAHKKEWEAVIPPNEMEHISLEGNHISCRTKYLPGLAEHLQQILEKLQLSAEAR